MSKNTNSADTVSGPEGAPGGGGGENSGLGDLAGGGLRSGGLGGDAWAASCDDAMNAANTNMAISSVATVPAMRATPLRVLNQGVGCEGFVSETGRPGTIVFSNGIVAARGKL
jgi:hypothetical protein